MEYRFRSILQPRLVRFDDAKEVLLKEISARSAALKNRLELAAAVLETGSPLAVMERGFSVVMDGSGRVIRNSADVKKGERLCIRPLKGTIHATAESIGE
jgi:exodeoxyribonuclease VII large subunit